MPRETRITDWVSPEFPSSLLLTSLCWLGELTVSLSELPFPKGLGGRPVLLFRG